ncbi:hypothetical protein NQ176_g7578 [Zarea fungicola]|uniref:Uncharacterized protein n=1 Tax=Zarea fungicola TaxID=93591 RepID=A0ACC1MYG0_9HYPO|nr:hypothetical protein NQ176_g7578 [Lecanicillium fungicola]
MGLLQENKSRNKISNDPNNTKWTRDITTFGQKILRSQGWQPGQFLGAQDAPHAELHSAASASYIRVVLKDDMKGLGFNKAKEDEVTGLDVFSDVLSRLNGKSEAAVEEDQRARLSIKTNRYVEMRWGPMRFVRGGLLVGDKLKREDGAEESDEDDGDSQSAAETKAAKAKAADSEAKRTKKEKKSKKRKVAEEDEDDDDDSDDTITADKKRRRTDGDEDAKKKRRSEKKEKKAKRARDDSEDSTAEDKDEKAARKRARKLRKQEKREKKEEKKRRKAAKAASKRDSDNSDSSSDSENDEETTTTSTGVSTPATVNSGTSTPTSTRNFSRSRIIAQKKRAVMDATALKQIFMVKA